MNVKKYLTRGFVSIHIALLLVVLTSMQFVTTALASEEQQAPKSYLGKATVKVVDIDNGIAKLAHEPIASLNWPAMTMNFTVKNRELLKRIKAGDAITFTFIQSDNDNIITNIQQAK